jgi:adenylate cyclase
VRCPHCDTEISRPSDEERRSDEECVDEIRTVTVLFADVAGSTEMTARLGLEVVKSLMDQIFERIYHVVVDHGGKVDKFIGDCVMALFGAPLAYGDDPARAVRAGLAILQTVAEMEPELEQAGLPQVRMRVGINTGPVIAGPVGAGSERRYTVLGHAVNVAAHLQQEAAVGTVLVGQGTYRRIRGLFSLQEQQTASGPAYVVQEEQLDGIWLRPREILGNEIEMVGRDHELELLLGMTRACAGGREARLALVVGEPGIGKSRLAFEFLARLEQQGECDAIVGYAHPLSAGVPFSVAADAMRRRLGGQDQEQMQQTMLTALEGLGGSSRERDLSTLSRVLGLPAEEGAEPEKVSPRRVLDLMVQLVDWQASRRPTVLVAEDLHWCDSATLSLLDELLRRLAHRPLLIVGFTRPEFAHEHPELAEGRQRQRIDLEPLDHDAVTSMVRQAVGEERSGGVLDFIARRALGNPYHVEELLRTLEERGVLERRVGGWELSGVPADLEIPPGVEAVTQARIDNLAPRQRRMLSQAAAVGRTFWDGLLRWLSDDFAPGDLSRLVQRELVVSRQGTGFSGSKEYSFVHDLTRDVAYRMLTEARRTSLHRRIAAWLEQQGANTTEELALVGRQFDLGGQPDRAALYLSRAGDAAFGAGAYTSAVLHFTRAIELTARADELDREQLFDLLARRERVLNQLGRWSEQRADAEQMLELAVELYSEERRTEALLRVGRSLLNVGDHNGARRAFREAHRLSLHTGDPNIQARSLRWQAMYHFNLGEHLQARPLFEQALALAEEHDLDELAAELAYELGVTAGTVGDYVRALDVSGQALEMFRRQGNRYQESFCLANIGCFHVYLGEYDEALPSLQLAAALGHELRIPLAEASAEANLGNAYRLLGRAGEALALEERVHQVAQEIGDSRLAADAMIYGALACLEVSDGEGQGEAMARSALALARECGMPGTEAVACMALARVLERQERFDDALEVSHAAVELLDRIGSVEGFEQEILQVHGALCAQVGLEQEAQQAGARARAEVERKASFIASEQRRRRFLDQVASRAILKQSRGADAAAGERTE